MTQEELNTIIKNHQHWLNHGCEGWDDMRANLKGADLKGLDLMCANLYDADLSNANLIEANLSGANLKYANLRGVKLKDAKLRDTFLGGACLSDADLYNAELTFACLEEANLKDANLMFANLFAANLNDVDLSGANLIRANLTGANLTGANLTGVHMKEANLAEAIFDKGEQCRLGMILTKSMKGYKKTSEGNVIELKIPKGAIVFSINNSECRANKAIVTKCEGVQHSWFDPGFEYKEGNTINIKGFNLQYNIECAEGIHFYRTKEEAEKYEIVAFDI